MSEFFQSGFNVNIFAVHYVIHSETFYVWPDVSYGQQCLALKTSYFLFNQPAMGPKYKLKYLLCKRSLLPCGKSR